jgi:phage repressor protein C with HTH and peptisase S24 domain
MRIGLIQSMPRKPSKPREIPPGATPQQIALHLFLKRHPTLAVNAWAIASGLSEGTIRNALTEAGNMTENTFRKLDDGALQLKGERLISQKKPTVRMAGKVGAGDIVSMFGGDSMQGDIELVDAPEGAEDPEELLALTIEGNSMRPLRPGWLIFYRKTHPGITDDELGQLCVVRLKNGNLYVKILRRGYTDGLFNLESWNADPLNDQDVEWATKVLNIVPR